MASEAGRAWLERQQQAVPDGQRQSPANTRPWLQHPVLIWAASLAALLFAPKLYNILAPSSILPIQEAQLQEVASLMDEIYTTLANMTFIPHHAIKRGPHNINATNIPCARDPAALRLMEIMPYVDRIDVMDGEDSYRTDWLFGGEFTDYRHLDRSKGDCTPLHFAGPEAEKEEVALTNHGTGGWNGDRTWVLLYDTARNLIRVFEGEMFLGLWDADDPGSDYTGIGVLTHSVTHPLSPVSRDELNWKELFDAPTLLRRILDAYQSLKWTPWETSNREGGYGVDPKTIKDLLSKNGWPDAFDPDQFNADFIRAKHAKRRHGPAQAAYKTIEDLQGNPNEAQSFSSIADLQRDIASQEAQLPTHTDYQFYWLQVFLLQSKKWRLEDLKTQLADAKTEVARLCPEDMCVKDEDMILWEFHDLEKTYETGLRATSAEKRCEAALEDFIDIPPDHLRLPNCIAHAKLQDHYFRLAYDQSRAATLSNHTPSQLIPQLSLEDLVAAENEAFERVIARNHAKATRMYDWVDTLPEDATEAREWFEREASAAANGPWYIRDRIEELREMLAGGEEKRRRLRKCFDDPECP